jgi:hypothetical protein
MHNDGKSRNLEWGGGARRHTANTEPLATLQWGSREEPAVGIASPLPSEAESSFVTNDKIFAWTIQKFL